MSEPLSRYAKKEARQDGQDACSNRPRAESLTARSSFVALHTAELGYGVFSAKLECDDRESKMRSKAFEEPWLGDLRPM